jgi:hypothetical protein
MPRRYFDLEQDMYVPGAWYPDEPTDSAGQEVDDVWQFTEGRPVHVEGRLRIPIDVPGTPLDFSTTAVGATPIVHPRVAAVFEQLAPDDVQLLPMEVEGQSEAYSVLVATRLIQCIDDKASRHVEVWTPEDGRPDRTGEYRNVRGLRIDTSKVGDVKVFRPWGWKLVLIVSEDIKDALERIGATGVKFTEV